MTQASGAGSHAELTAKPAPRKLPLATRLAILVLALIASGLYMGTVSRAYRALQWAENVTPDNLKTAAAREPFNAEFRYRSGRYSLLMQDFPNAISNFQAAIALNPYDARYWLDLANADLASGNPAGTRQALARAMEADPTTPEVVWQTANYALVEGETELALRRFHDLVENDNDVLLAVLNVCWRATRDPDLIAAKVLPSRPEAYFTLIRFLWDKRPEGAADKVWSQLIALKRPFPVTLAFPYFDFLLSQGKSAQVEEAWRQSAVANPDFSSYVPSDNRIVNGGFELELLNGGLDWRYSPQPGASVVIDDQHAHSGSRSLAITFEGTPVDSGVVQLVPARHNTRYQFSGFMMAENLETVSPPRLAIFGVNRNEPYLLTDGASAAADWREFRGEFTTGPQDDLLLVRIVRIPGQKLIRGKIWVDDVKLVPVTNSRSLP